MFGGAMAGDFGGHRGLPRRRRSLAGSNGFERRPGELVIGQHRGLNGGHLAGIAGEPVWPEASIWASACARASFGAGSFLARPALRSGRLTAPGTVTTPSAMPGAALDRKGEARPWL